MRVIDFANEVLEMQDELEFLRAENKRLRQYEQAYNKLLDESVSYSQHMVVGLIAIAAKRPDLLPALEKAP